MFALKHRRRKKSKTDGKIQWKMSVWKNIEKREKKCNKKKICNIDFCFVEYVDWLCSIPHFIMIRYKYIVDHHSLLLLLLLKLFLLLLRSWISNQPWFGCVCVNFVFIMNRKSFHNSCQSVFFLLFNFTLIEGQFIWYSIFMWCKSAANGDYLLPTVAMCSNEIFELIELISTGLQRLESGISIEFYPVSSI